MRSDEPPKQVNDQHPVYTRIIQVGVATISTGLLEHTCFVYRLESFADVARPVLRSSKLDLPFYTFIAAFRSSLSHFCPEPVLARETTDHLIEWAEDCGIQGLVGLQPSSNATKVYLTHPTAMVMCRIEFT